jgi:hypothetical protein
MTIAQAMALGFALGLCVSPLLVLGAAMVYKRNRQREDPWCRSDVDPEAKPS